ncbi:MAG: ADP-ribosylglycohydrolase family protein [Ruminococcaceae bacterium]|nr:ADP-ribosylglycohydrolase family protein [Oscillospiraceae bacterium]
MIRINKQELRDKIYACWLGKNIGGTIGGPFEGDRRFLNVTGFTTDKGEPMPNDDLDLQLVWLLAVEEHGTRAITSQLLGEYWMRKITPEWNEYGICKANLARGIMPPLSGELFNEKWKHSNGAWIRSEIWACLFPGIVDSAVALAIEDAMVDHGMGEGTYAEIFTAALESAAFVVKDVRKLIDIAFSKIPDNCRVAKAAKIAIDCYDNGVSLRDAREKVRLDTEDLGWFQAPANLGYVVLGLLYGEGDFKKSLLCAVNCGDDTDCTAATVGSVLGIMGGTAAIPSDWREYIGDKIVTVSIALKRGRGDVPATCTELTDRVMALVENSVNTALRPFYGDGTYWPQPRAMEFTDGQTDYGNEHELWPMDSKQYITDLCNRSPYSYEIDLVYATARVEYTQAPFIKPFETKKATVKFFTKTQQTNSLNFRFLTPEGFTAKGSRGVTLCRLNTDTPRTPALELEVTAGEKLEYMNRVVVEVTAENHAIVGYIPVCFIG